MHSFLACRGAHVYTQSIETNMNVITATAPFFMYFAWTFKRDFAVAEAFTYTSNT